MSSATAAARRVALPDISPRRRVVRAACAPAVSAGIAFARMLGAASRDFAEALEPKPESYYYCAVRSRLGPRDDSRNVAFFADGVHHMPSYRGVPRERAMTGSIDHAMTLASDGRTRFGPRLGDDDRKRRGDGSPGSAVITKTKPVTKRPNMYRVLLLNDDYTPMEFVVHVLERFFNKDRETATRIMLHVHQHGIGECGVFTYEVAETKVTQVMDFARKHQHPLQCVMEKK
jgi:ATP-dependent Clp protease adaptor protein ClpS